MAIRNKGGYFFSVDALIGMLLILAIVILIKPQSTYTSYETRVQDDLLKTLSDMKIGDLNNSYVELLILNSSITEVNNTVLEQIGEFYALNDPLASQVAQNILDELSLDFGISLYYDDYLVANNTPVNFSASESVRTSRFLVSGIMGGVNASSGFSSRAFLFSENKIQYFYFGGYVGDGNITAYIGENVASATIEGDFYENFSLYINDLYVGDYTGNPGNPQSIDLSSHLSKFSSASNNISFRSDSYLAIAGGFIRVVYNDTNFQDNVKFLPGISGFINLFDSFTVPGNLTGVDILLHYNSTFEIFMQIGDVEVYQGNSSGSELNVTITNATLFSLLNYSLFSENTVPLRIGLVNITDIEGATLDSDVYSVTDISGSMAGTKMTNAKAANKDLIDIVLNYSGNRVGLVGYEDNALEADHHSLSNNNASLRNLIDTVWDADGGTCICCGINKAALEMSQSSTPSLSDGLVLYLTFDNHTNDSSVSGLNGTIYGSPTYVSGINESGLEFHGNLGNNDYVVVPNNDSIGLNGMDEVTFSMWIYPEDDSQYWTLGGTTNDWDGDGFNMYLRGGQTNNEYSFTIDRNNGGDYTRGSNIVEDAWHHVVGTYDGSTMRLYVDGVEVNSDTTKSGAINANDEDLYIGRIFGYVQDYFYGVIDEVRIYDRALNSTEVSSLYDSTPVCGNGAVEVSEVCDGADAACSLGSGNYGKHTCDVSCGGYGSCVETSVCGDGYKNSTEMCDDGNLFDNDGCSSLCVSENRQESMIVMSDGDANRQCTQQGTGTSTGDAIQAACDAYNNYGIIIYAVGFGSGADETTLQSIASCGQGSYYYGDVDDLEDIYRQIAEDILNAAYDEQRIIGNGSIMTLYPDSKITLTYDSTPLPYGLSITSESSLFGNIISDGFFDVPSDSTPFRAGVVSYSGSKWTGLVQVYNNTSSLWEPIFNLTDYGFTYTDLGDPYLVNIPVEKIVLGRNDIRVITAVDPTNQSTFSGSVNNKIVYTVVKDIAAYSPVLPSANGCTWHVEFEDFTNETRKFPSTYNGTDDCYFASNDYFFAGNNVLLANTQDAISVAILNLFEILDLNGNNRLETKFTDSDLDLSSVEIEGLPFTVSTEVQARTWR